MKKGYFITGTDTGVGKTIVTATLALTLRRQGFKVAVMKPVETGCREEGGRLLPQDALFLRTTSKCTAPLELITPYAFSRPLAPALAAELAGTTIDIKRIRWCYEQLLSRHDIVLVEGAGGLLVPLTDQVTMLDLAVSLNLSLFVVARNVLGTINHTSLTVAVARRRCAVLGVVLNHTEPPTVGDLAQLSNHQSLRRWSGAPICCELPYISELSEGALQSLGELLVTDRLLASMGIGTYPVRVPSYTTKQPYIHVEEKDGIPGARR